MQRDFIVYRPRQIAIFVKTLFKGHFNIHGIGSFKFDQGKVLLPNINNAHQLSVFREINREILALSMEEYSGVAM